MNIQIEREHSYEGLRIRLSVDNQHVEHLIPTNELRYSLDQRALIEWTETMLAGHMASILHQRTLAKIKRAFKETA